MCGCLHCVIFNKSETLVRSELYVFNLAEYKEVFVEGFLSDIRRKSTQPYLSH